MTRRQADPRKAAEDVFKRTAPKVPEPEPKGVVIPTGREGNGDAPHRPGRARPFPGRRPRLAGSDQRGVAYLHQEIVLRSWVPVSTADNKKAGPPCSEPAFNVHSDQRKVISIPLRSRSNDRPTDAPPSESTTPRALRNSMTRPPPATVAPAPTAV